TSSLVLFVGAVLGVLLYTKVKSDIDKKLAENIQKFYINLNKLNSQDVNLLNNFLRELLAIV
ncbi:MAG TPA: iron dependent repressor, partial [Thermoanaerobacter sp.]|nr:iron dependent repressor [Thermoanaerobacter sp.]